jgi:ATP phosphoribosyltransferase
MVCLKNVSADKTAYARAEDIPFLLQQYANAGKTAVGLTGEDLYKEFLLNRATELEVLRRLEWNDKKAVFGKPALCLLGPNNKTLNEVPNKARVYIATKYKRLANCYLEKYKKQGFKFKLFYVNGCIERSISEGLADLVIDIVYTGRTIRESSLQVYEKIQESNFLILGTKKGNKND